MRLDKRTFLYSATVLACSNIGLQALGFVYRIALSRLAGAEGLGVYRLVFSVYIVINSFCLSGVTMACSRLAAAKMAQGRPGQLRALMRLATGLFLTIFALCVAVIVPFHDFIAQNMLGDDRTAAALPIMLVCLFLTGFENIIKALFIGMGRVKYAAVSETGEQIIRMIAVVLLLLYFGKQDYGRIAALIMLGMAISECFSAGFLGLLYRRNIACCAQTKSHGLLRETLSIAAPISLAAVCSNLISSASAVILPARLVCAGLTRSGALSALGVVSGMAGPLITLPVALVGAVSAVLVPSITAAQARGDHRRVRALAGKTLTVTGLIGIPATAALVPLSPALARIFFGQAIPLPYMALLGISAVASYYQMMTASVLNGIGEQRRAVLAAVCGELMQLGLTWSLAARPGLQIYGYLLSMAICPVPVALVNLWGILRKTGLQLRPFQTFGVPVLCGVTVFLWARVFYACFLGVCGAQWGAVLLAAASAAALYLILLRLLGVRIGAYLASRMASPPPGVFFGFL